MELAESAANELSKIYLKSSRYLTLKADEIFEKFQRKHHLSEEQARKLIAELHDSSSIDELLRLLKSDPKNKDLAAELESAAYQARLERLRQLQNEINLVMVEIYQQEKNFTTPFYADLANETYYKSMFDIQQRIGIGFSFNRISEKQINKVLSMDWSGENYSKRIWKNTQNLAKDLREELLVNLLTGRTNREAAEIISNKFASGASKARRLVRTESNFVSSELNFEAYKEAGVEEYQFLATLDLKTSKICRELDGKKFKVSERKVGVNCNPMHPWCRSTTVAVVDEKYTAQKMRSARDPETGEVIKVPQSMDYKEWYDKFVKGKPEAKLADKKQKNHSGDKKQYKKYREVLGNHIPEKLDDFQNVKYTDIDKWNELQEAYRDINWQRKALENQVSGELHSAPTHSAPNSVYDNYKDGKLIQRRYYGKTGKPRLDIDMTNHGNPKNHPVVPHFHNWNEIGDGTIRRDTSHDNKLKLGYIIANKDIL